MVLLRLRYEAECLTSQLTKQNLSGQLIPTPDRNHPYRASGLVHWLPVDINRFLSAHAANFNLGLSPALDASRTSISKLN
jgi:hypothetical protein